MKKRQQPPASAMNSIIIVVFVLSMIVIQYCSSGGGGNNNDTNMFFSVEALSVAIDTIVAPFQRATLKSELKTIFVARKKTTSRKRKNGEDADYYDNQILELSKKLRKWNPTTDIQKDFNKLNGDWKLEYTTAPAQEVPRDDDGDDDDDDSSTVPATVSRTNTKTYQTIDTTIGLIYNVIDQRGSSNNKKNQGRVLKIAVGAEPTRKDRVALDFRTIEVINDNDNDKDSTSSSLFSSFPVPSFPPKTVTLSFPPRSFFRAVTKVQKFVQNIPYNELEFKELAYFDIIYLDDNLRIQQNSEGNLFINSRISKSSNESKTTLK